MGHDELNLGHHGAGDDCFGKVFRYFGGGATAGAAYGTVEGCFLKPVKGSTTPMIFRAFQVIASRAVLIGEYADEMFTLLRGAPYLKCQGRGVSMTQAT